MIPIVLEHFLKMTIQGTRGSSRVTSLRELTNKCILGYTILGIFNKCYSKQLKLMQNKCGKRYPCLPQITWSTRVGHSPPEPKDNPK